MRTLGWAEVADIIGNARRIAVGRTDTERWREYEPLHVPSANVRPISAPKRSCTPVRSRVGYVPAACGRPHSGASCTVLPTISSNSGDQHVRSPGDCPPRYHRASRAGAERGGPSGAREPRPVSGTGCRTTTAPTDESGRTTARGRYCGYVRRRGRKPRSTSRQASMYVGGGQRGRELYPVRTGASDTRARRDAGDAAAMHATRR